MSRCYRTLVRLTFFTLALTHSTFLANAADVEVRVQSVVLDNAVGFSDFDVELINQTGAAVTMGSFNLNLEITPLSPRAIQFSPTTQPDMFTAPLWATYIFNGDSEGATQAAPYVPWTITSNAGTNNNYVFTDSVLTGSSGVTIANGATRLLSRVRIISDTAIKNDSFTVSVVTGATGTLLSDPAFVAIPFTTTNGTVSVVPEPSTYALATLATSALALIARRRKARTA